jgi:hypothetical protein
MRNHLLYAGTALSLCLASSPLLPPASRWLTSRAGRLPPTARSQQLRERSGGEEETQHRQSQRRKHAQRSAQVGHHAGATPALPPRRIVRLAILLHWRPISAAAAAAEAANGAAASSRRGPSSWSGVRSASSSTATAHARCHPHLCRCRRCDVAAGSRGLLAHATPPPHQLGPAKRATTGGSTSNWRESASSGESEITSSGIRDSHASKL